MLNCASMIYFFRNMAICNFKLKLFDRMLYRDLDGYHCAGVSRGPLENCGAGNIE
jgi:hypothetical protein